MCGITSAAKESESIQVGRFEFNDATELDAEERHAGDAQARPCQPAPDRRRLGSPMSGRSFDGARYSWSQPSTDSPW